MAPFSYLHGRATGAQFLLAIPSTTVPTKWNNGVATIQVKAALAELPPMMCGASLAILVPLYFPSSTNMTVFGLRCDGAHDSYNTLHSFSGTIGLG